MDESNPDSALQSLSKDELTPARQIGIPFHHHRKVFSAGSQFQYLDPDQQVVFGIHLKINTNNSIHLAIK
jgi:hypothetical protein